MADIKQIQVDGTTYNLKDEAAREMLALKQPLIEEVLSTYVENGGSPTATASTDENGNLVFNFQNLKLKFSDLSENDKDAIRGLQGESAIWDENEPHEKLTDLVHVLGNSTVTPMSQKGITDEMVVDFDGKKLATVKPDYFYIVYSTGKYNDSSYGHTTHYMIPNDGYMQLKYKAQSKVSYASVVSLYSSMEVSQDSFIGSPVHGGESAGTVFEGIVDLTQYSNVKMIVVSTRVEYVDETYIALSKKVRDIVVGISDEFKSNYEYNYVANDFVKNQMYILPNGDLATGFSQNAGRLTLYLEDHISDARITAKCGGVDANATMIACYSAREISSEYLLGTPILLQNGTKTKECVVPEGTKMVIITNRTGSESNPTVKLTYRGLTKSNAEDITTIKNQISDIYGNINGTGSHLYYGRRIKLNLKEQMRYSNRTDVYRETWGEGNIRYRTQSHAMYGGRMFVFLDGGGINCSVYSVDGNTITWLEDAEVGLNAHFNNAQFSNIFYSSSDAFPILLISSGDEASEGQPNYYYWVRITVSDGHYFFSLLKTVEVRVPYSNNTASFVANFAARRMFMYCTKLNYRTSEGNESYIFEVPFVGHDDNKSSITSEDNVRLVYRCPTRLIWQGACENAGKLFMPAAGVNQINGLPVTSSGNLAPTILVIDEDTGEIISYIPNTDNIEIEGLCVYDNSLWMTQRNGGTTHASTDVIFLLKKFVF